MTFYDHATDDRNDRMVVQWQNGATYGELARAFGLSRERCREIVKGAAWRAFRRELPISVRAWNVLQEMGLLSAEEAFPALWRRNMSDDELRARIRTVDLETIGAHYNAGLVTVRELAAFIGCPDQFKQRSSKHRGSSVVRVQPRPPISTRAWNVLAAMGLVKAREWGTITRDELIARIHTVGLDAIAAQKIGVGTMNELAVFVGCPDLFEERVVRVRVEP